MPSGLTIGSVLVGFAWVWNEGHDSATFNVFETDDGLQQLSIGRRISPPTGDEAGETVTRSGRVFAVYDERADTRVTEDVGNDTRVGVLSDSLELDTLLQIAESITEEPDTGERVHPHVQAAVEVHGHSVPPANAGYFRIH